MTYVVFLVIYDSKLSHFKYKAYKAYSKISNSDFLQILISKLLNSKKNNYFLLFEV